jgi:hypothetical protein
MSLVESGGDQKQDYNDDDALFWLGENEQL